MPAPEDLIAKIERLGEDYATYIAGQSDAAFHHRPAPEEWTAAELTGHVAEFPVTFSGQAQRVAASPGLRIGRGLDDPDRLAAVAKLAGAGPAEAAAAVRDGVRQAAATLRGISPDDWQATGQHASGELTVRQIVERFVVGHIQVHIEQARKTIEASRQ